MRGDSVKRKTNKQKTTPTLRSPTGAFGEILMVGIKLKQTRGKERM